MSSNPPPNGAEGTPAPQKKKRAVSRLHTRANRSVPFFVADPLIKQYLPDKMRTQNINAYFTVAAEEMLVDLLQRAGRHVQTKGVTKNGRRKGRLKASHIAKALADKQAPYYGVLPERVAGEFVKDDTFRALLKVSGSPTPKRKRQEQEEQKVSEKRIKKSSIFPSKEKAAALKDLYAADPTDAIREDPAELLGSLPVSAEDEDDAAAEGEFEEDDEEDDDEEEEEEDSEDEESE